MRPLDDFYRDHSLNSQLRVLGSGFLVKPAKDDKWGGPYVLACAHVVAALLTKLKENALPEDAAFLHFVYPEGGAPMASSFRRFKVKEVRPDYDVAFLRVSSDDGLPPLPLPLTAIKTTDQVIIGEEIGLVGYPHGVALLEDPNTGKPWRTGPVLHRGYVSALAPHESIGPPQEILLDLLTAGGASGSPVFRVRTGEVVGMLARTQVGENAIISMAIPLFDHGDGTLRIQGRYRDIDMGPPLFGIERK
jgi:Trypsin-like peptidase domain